MSKLEKKLKTDMRKKMLDTNPSDELYERVKKELNMKEKQKQYLVNKTYKRWVPILATSFCILLAIVIGVIALNNKKVNAKEYNAIVQVDVNPSIQMVVDEENKVVGIISETDIMKKESHVDSPRMLNFIQGIIFLDDMKKFEDEMRAIAAYKVEDLMSKDIITVNENDTFDYVANVMINKSINRVPVVDENNFLKGIICRYDIIKAMYN